MSRDDRDEGMRRRGSEVSAESRENAEHALDVELSALLDGELEPEREAALRRRLASDDALAERFDSFQRLDAALRDLPARELPGDLAGRLRERIAAEGARDEGAAPPRSSPAALRFAAPRRRGRGLRWGLPAAAAALAAGVALVVLWQGPVDEGTVALQPPAQSDQALLEELDAAPDEDLALALELETLGDLEVIEDLDLLELLIAAELPESGG